MSWQGIRAVPCAHGVTVSVGWFGEGVTVLVRVLLDLG